MVVKYVRSKRLRNTKNVDMKLNEKDTNEDMASCAQVPVGRTQTENLIAVIFQRLMSVLLAFAMLLMGCELKFAVVRGYLRRPLAPCAGMVCQYCFMPAMAFLIGLALMPDNTMARYGLILIGSSPGGSFSNFWTGR